MSLASAQMENFWTSTWWDCSGLLEADEESVEISWVSQAPKTAIEGVKSGQQQSCERHFILMILEEPMTTVGALVLAIQDNSAVIYMDTLCWWYKTMQLLCIPGNSVKRFVWIVPYANKGSRTLTLNIRNAIWCYRNQLCFVHTFLILICCRIASRIKIFLQTAPPFEAKEYRLPKKGKTKK